MQNKISKKIIDKLRLNEKIASKEEIIKTITDSEKIYKQKLNLTSLWTYLRKDKYIRRILGDFYYIYSLEERYNRNCKFSEEELMFLTLEKMNAKWYLGLERALVENKIIWQVLTEVTVINNKFSGIKKIGNTKLRFIKANHRFNFGLIKKKTNNSAKYFYSDPEKTYLDFLHFFSYEGKDVNKVKKSLDFKVNGDILKKYVKKYNKKIQKLIR